MKKQSSKLFEKFEIKSSQQKQIFGGNETSNSSDTNMAGGFYDVLFDTSNGAGSTSIDSAKTGPGTNKDKPLPR